MKAGIGNTIVNLRKDSGGPSFTGMITEWTVTAGQTITLRGQQGSGATYLFDVDWGDSSTETGITISNKTHTYTDAGTYTVKISGQFAGWEMGGASATDRASLTNFVQWGTETVIQGVYRMFQQCGNMVYSATDNPTITLTANVNNKNRADFIFYLCESVTNLDLSGWNWTNPEIITVSSSMFADCFNLENLNLTGWNFANSNTFQTCFRKIGSTTTNGCNFEWDNLSTKAINFYYFFQRARLSSFSMENLTFTDISAGVNCAYMFYQTELLFSTLDLSSWDVSKVDDMTYMFRTTNFTGTNTFELNVTGWDTTNLADMFGWVYECRYLTDIIGLSDLRGDSLITNGFQSAFFNATRLTFNNNNFHDDFGLNWNIDTMNSAFYGVASQSGTSSVPPNTTNWNTSIVTNFNQVFANFDFSTPNYTMFDVSSGTNLNAMFYLGSGIVNLDFSQSNMSNSNTTMTNFGRSHSTLQTVDFSNCDFSGVTSFSHMFFGAPINSLTFDNTVSFASLSVGVNFLQNNIGAMTTAEYDNFLVRLDTTGLTGAYTLTAGDSTYTTGGAGDTARANLVTKGWTVTDDGGV